MMTSRRKNLSVSVFVYSNSYSMTLHPHQVMQIFYSKFGIFMFFHELARCKILIFLKIPVSPFNINCKNANPIMQLYHCKLYLSLTIDYFHYFQDLLSFTFISIYKHDARASKSTTITLKANLSFIHRNPG